MPGWSNRIVIKASNIDQKCSIEFDSDFGAHKFLDLSRDDTVIFLSDAHSADEKAHEIRVRPDRTAE
eukprot:6019646-Heterocapsa_arctica.AAC.1